jgi:lipid II:glycine glycyltransferase (peptidoglycan interpeptide bridge formation enzyme)
MDGLSLSALIVQPPDDAADTEAALLESGFRPSRRLGIIDSTLLIPMEDFRGGPHGKIGRTRRQSIRKAVDSGVEIREGGREALGDFFGLLRATCRRQGARRINPASPDSLERLWHEFAKGGNLRMTFAVLRGEILAGLLCIAFGDRLTLWKKGWSGASPECRPNDLLYHEALTWARDRGFRTCDFAGLGRSTAESLLWGKPLSPGQLASRDGFNLSFGGVPRLLPGGMIRFRSRLAGAAFSIYERF